MIRSFRPFLSSSAPLLLAACAPQGDFPSLAPRAIETAPDEPAEQPSPPPAPADPVLAARVEELLAEAEAGQRDFAGAAPAAETAVARAGASGSESWVAAQQAVSRLQAARGGTVEALAALDRLAVERANQPTNPNDFQSVQSAIERASALAQTQSAVISRLQARLTR